MFTSLTPIAPLRLALLAAAIAPPLVLAQDKGPSDSPAPEVIRQITAVDASSDGSTLTVKATGDAPTPNYTDPRLTPVVYVQQPPDGIQDYYFTAVKPSGPQAQVMTPIAAEHKWEKVPGWIKGVRIHGEGEGVMVKMLSGKPAPAPGPNRIIVPNITNIQLDILKKNPPTLVVTATGEVPYPLHTDPQLDRVLYLVPPADGIQDYYLRATPPASPPINPVPEKVSAKNEWPSFQKDAPWLKGVRVHGLGEGVRVEMLKK